MNDEFEDDKNVDSLVETFLILSKIKIGESSNSDERKIPVQK